MQRLISLFRDPQDDWPDPASLAELNEPKLDEAKSLKPEPKGADLLRRADGVRPRAEPEVPLAAGRGGLMRKSHLRPAMVQ